MSETADLIVIGGGIHGCSAALHAAIRGLSVIVIEKDTVARHASGANAGGVRRLNRPYAEIPLSQHSMAIWNRIEDLVDDDCGFQHAPQIQFAETEAHLETMTARVAKLRALGHDYEEILDQARLQALVPAAARHFLGGIASLQDGFALPYRTTFAFQRKATTLGVRFRERHAAQRIWREGGDWKVLCGNGETFSGRNVLNCAGVWARSIAEQIGEKAPITAYAPMMIVTNRLPHFCDVVAIGPPGLPLSFKQMANGTVVIGGGQPGTPHPQSNVSEMRFEHLRLSAKAAIEVFPVMSSATVVRSWSGIEGCMPDGAPVIGASSTEENVFHAFGFSGHGFQLGPGVGEIMAELIASGATSAPIAPFTIKRFQAGGALETV